MRSIDCQHPSPFALHHLPPPPPPPPLPPSLPPIRATPSPCLVRALTFSLFLSLLFVVLYCAAICSPLLLPHGDALFSPFRPRARALCCCIISPTSVFAPYTLRSPPRGGLSRLLSRLWDNYLSIRRERVFPRNTAQDETESQDDTRDMQSLANARYVTAIGYESEKRSILKTDRTALGVERGNSRSNLSRGARLTLRVMKCNEKKVRRKPDVLRIIMLRLTTPQ